MKKLLVTLVLMALVVFGAYKAAVWWLTEQDLKQARAELESFGVLEWGSIHSSVAGQLTLRGNGYQSFHLTQPLEIGEASLDASSPWALLQLLADPARLPSHWEFQARDVGLALDAAMFRSWVSAGDNGGNDSFAPVCGPDHRQRLGSGDLVRIGITEVSGEALLRQSPDRLHAELVTDGTGSIEIDWPGARFRLLEPQSLWQDAPGPLTLTLRDGGTMRRIAAYCARESGLAVDEWTASALAALKARFRQAGLAPSRQLQALYRRWLADGGELVVVLDPRQGHWGLPVRAANTHSGADGTTNDGAELAARYNGAEVPGLFLNRVAAAVSELPTEALEPVVPRDRSLTQPGWRTVTVESASQWLGHRVRVTLNNGRTVQGRLDRADDRELEVARAVDGGEVAYPMMVRAVATLKVWRRGGQPSSR
ncbi:acetylornithine deacetylase [Marinobacter xestospongiae]|uniref:Acetylornithine deacetylase n=1 Tax=Marinobacter xestospongiae TaxID=994319 RepID=A0ABU3VWD3_9GAMM|nr:acetylornithine deacetylase [Marinobacter xestospongiae]MDV2078584.1 acetylornithine deacetylase [Marinobacter xestospongiae]